MKKIISSLLFCVLLFTTACAPAPDPTFTQGSAFTIGDWEVVVHGYEAVDIIESGLFYFQPDAGNEFVVLDISVTNNSNDKDTFTSGMILSPKYVQPTIEMGGASYEVVVMSGYIEGIVSKAIEAGETLRGNFVFEVPQGAANDGFTLTLTLDKTKVSGEVA